MRLDELKLDPGRKACFLGRHGEPNTIMRSDDGLTYNIWKGVRPGYGLGTESWYRIDPLTAQCIICILTGENEHERSESDRAP